MGASSCCSSSPVISEEELQTLASSKDCHFDPRELRDLMLIWLERHPNGNASKAELMSFFTGVSSATDNTFLERTVAALDENHNGVIDFREAVLGLSVLLRGDHEAKVRFLFHALDADDSNSLSKAELKAALEGQVQMLRGHTKSSDTSESNRLAEDTKTRVDKMFAKGDFDGDGVLSLTEFLKLVESEPSLRQHFTVADEVCHFNTPDMSTKKRMEALRILSQTLVKDSPAIEPEAAAKTLHIVPGLSPVAIGEFLGSKDTDGFMKTCLKLFFNSLELKGTFLDQALRLMSQKICLPREAQQIDRIVQAFAEAYVDANPKSLPDEDAAYLTAFAIVMLNADAHTENVKKKMTKAEFVKNCSLATPQVNVDLLEGIYDRVVAEEIILSAKMSSGGLEESLRTLGRTELSTMLGSLKA